MVLDYLYINKNLESICLFTIEDIIKKYGLTPRSGKEGMIDQFKSILLSLHNLKIIELENLDLKPQKMYKCKFIINLDSNFFYLNDDNKNKILNYQSDENVDNFKLLLFYCYLLSRIYHRPEGQRDINISGGKPEVCYPTYKQINKDTKLSEAIIKKYINILVKLDLIRVGNAGVYYMSTDKHKRPFESANTYVLYDKIGRWKDELKTSIKIYKNMYPERVFVKKYKNNNKSENGYISRITYLEKQGKATKKQLEKRDKLLEKKQNLDDNDSIKFTIKSILDEPDNVNKLLSDIYYEQGNINLSEKYSNIESQLDIIDAETGEFLIDWDYYKWLMINYTAAEHEYYYNCVQKNIRENNIFKTDGDYNDLY